MTIPEGSIDYVKGEIKGKFRCGCLSAIRFNSLDFLSGVASRGTLLNSDWRIGVCMGCIILIW